jgi:hypothetical protein
MPNDWCLVTKYNTGNQLTETYDFTSGDADMQKPRRKALIGFGVPSKSSQTCKTRLAS